MRPAIQHYGWALLLAVPLNALAEGSWLAAEIRAQEARWAAQRDDRTAPSRPVGVATLGTSSTPRRAVDIAHQARRKDNASTFPVVTARSVPARSAGDGGSGPTLPTRARPADPSGVAQTILASARQHRIDPLLVRAVILTESAGQRRATSPKGAMGLMQLMPATARRFGVADPYDPDQNIAGGARYLRWLLDRYGGDVMLALAGYNAGEGAVDRYGGIPPYRETRTYVRTVRDTHQFLSRRVEHLAREARQ